MAVNLGVGMTDEQQRLLNDMMATPGVKNGEVGSTPSNDVETTDGMPPVSAENNEQRSWVDENMTPEDIAAAVDAAVVDPKYVDLPMIAKDR